MRNKYPVFQAFGFTSQHSMNFLRRLLFVAACIALPAKCLFGDIIPYNPSLASPIVGLENGSGQPSAQPVNSTTLPPGNYDYEVTAIYTNGSEGPATNAGIQIVDGNEREPMLIVHNSDSQSAGAITAYNVYRGFNGGLHYFVFSITASASYVTYQFQGDTTTAAHGNELEPGEAQANAIPASGYTATAKSRVYEGDGCTVTVTPITAASNSTNLPVQFASPVSMTVTNSDGQAVTVAVPRAGAQVAVPMLQSGSKTVTVSSGGTFADPSSSMPVTVLPGLRSTVDTGHVSIPANPFPTNLAYQTSSTTPALELIGTVQGRRALMFAQGETVGFVIPYEDLFRAQTNVCADSYEVHDFEGNLVEHGSLALTPSHSVVLNTAIITPGNYRLGIYNSAKAAQGQVDSMGWWSFVVFATNQSHLPLLGVGGNADLPGANGYLQLEQTPGSTPINSEAALNNFTSKQSTLVNFVRRLFVFTPTISTTATLSVAAPGRILINGQVVQQISLQFFSDDHYTPVSYTFTAGVPYLISVETLQMQGTAVPALTSSANGLFTSTNIRSLSNRVGKVTVEDYPGNAVMTSGDHNDITYRATLGAAGSMVRYALSATSVASDLIGVLQMEQSLNLGARDPARPRRRVVLTLPGLASWAAQSGVYTPGGLTSFLQAVIAGGINPLNLAIEFCNEPDGDGGYGTGAAYAQVFAQFAAAVRSASPSITIIGPGTVSINSTSRIWIDSFLSQLASGQGLGYLDGFSFHCYNDIEGNLGNGQASMDALVALLTTHGIGSIPLWQTEQGYPDAYNGTSTPRFGPRCLGAQLVLFDQYNLPCERNNYWFVAGEYINAPYLYMTTFKGVNVYPNALMLRTWSDELAGKAYISKYTLSAPWNKVIFGNLYKGVFGSEAVLMTDGETSLNVPVTVTGIRSGILTTVGWDGKVSTVAVANGTATINLCDLPTFIRLPAGATVTPNPPVTSADFAAGATFSSPYQIDNANMLNDGVWIGSQRVNNFGVVPQIQQSTASTDVPLELDFGSTQTFNMVVLSCAMPFQNDGSLLDFDLQCWDSSQQTWVTFQSNTEEVRAFPQYGVCEPISLIDYSKGRHQFVLQFARQTTAKLRLLIHNVTYGGCPTDATQAYTTSAATAIPAIREFAVYNTTTP